MPEVSEVKRGMVVDYQGKTWIVREVEKSAPTSRGGTWVFRFKLESVPGGGKLDISLRGGEQLAEKDLTRRAVQFSYRDGEAYVFMDAEDFSQYSLDAQAVGDLPWFMTEDRPLDGLQILIVDEQPVGLQLPQTVELEVVDTPPYVKGATATGRAKPAKLSTGLEVMVPEYIENGTRVRVHTETREYAGRA